MPESVATASEYDWIYVSNVNADQPGFISRLTKSGQLDTLKWHQSAARL